MNKQNNLNGEQLHDFVLFTANYPYLFIEHCWKGKGSLMTHIRDKFDSSKSFIDFWFMLDSENRDILANYVSKWSTRGKDKSFYEDYESSVDKLSWDDVKNCCGSKYQKEFYLNLTK
jgi:hypothetical protein